MAHTAIEYGLIAALMAIVIITGLQALGGETGALYTVIDTITAAIETALSSSTPAGKKREGGGHAESAVPFQTPAPERIEPTILDNS